MKWSVLVFLLVILTGGAALADEAAVDFRRVQGKDIYAWLTRNNFIMERSADDRVKTKLSVTDKGLVMESLKPNQSIIALKKGRLESYKEVEIVWGVNKFPPGASYAKGRRNEAILFYAFFGTEMIDSGGMIVPDSPYFIALHLCENDPIGVPLKGGYYHKGGRFICVAHPKPGEKVTTRFNLAEAFQKIYGFPAPPLYGMALEFDTRDPLDNGTSSAFVQSIEFPRANYIRE